VLASLNKPETVTQEAAKAPAALGSGTGTATAAAAVQQPWKWEESKDALVAYGVLAGVLGAGALNTSLLRSDNSSDLFYFVALAVTTQYIGAHRGLTTQQRQQISIKEGLLAPVFASVSLFGCYLLIRFFPDLSISTLLNAYFWLLGSFAGIGALGPLLRQLGGDTLGKPNLSVPLPEGWATDEEGKPVTKVEFAPTDVLAVVGALGLSSAYFVTQNYMLNNLMACLIATDILQLIGIRSFRVAGLLLVGLLAYDVFWVFGSPDVVGENVMLTVATSNMITGPTRLLFPRTPGGLGEAADFPYSLLGLGDIAVPGLLACLALRYDASRSVDMKGRAVAAAAAIRQAMDGLEVGASGRQIADATASAAEKAYDKFADEEVRHRNNTLDGTNDGRAPAAAASNGNGASSSSSGSSDSSGDRVVASEAVLENRVYFTPVMVMYVVGLLSAFAANSITHLGQPALLYIVPCTLGAVLGTGLLRNDLGKLWSFTDAPSFGIPQKKDSKEDKN